MVRLIMSALVIFIDALIIQQAILNRRLPRRALEWIFLAAGAEIVIRAI